MNKSSPKDFQRFNNQFWLAIKRLSLGVFLIILTSSILLISDWNRRKPGVKRIPRVAILQYSSQQVLVEGVEGILERLAGNGFIDGQTISLKRYNAEGDVATLNAIAREVTNGQFDMVLTVSTPAMQAVAKANKDGKAIHVFGLVTDPFGVGAGISPDNPLDHPEHLVGVPTILPAQDSFRLAKKLFPGLKSVGVV